MRVNMVTTHHDLQTLMPMCPSVCLSVRLTCVRLLRDLPALKQVNVKELEQLHLKL